MRIVKLLLFIDAQKRQILLKFHDSCLLIAVEKQKTKIIGYDVTYERSALFSKSSF